MGVLRRSADYDEHGGGYALRRRPEPAIAAAVRAGLGDARTVVNVGAGAGSYEPRDLHVIAFEPSATMRAQRPRSLAPAIRGRAEELPLDDDAVDAAMAVATVHHWDDPERGVRELRRVARGPVVIVTFDVDALAGNWLAADYLPELVAADRARFPAVATLAAWLGGGVEVAAVTIPLDCADGFVEAYYGRPEAFLDPTVRAAQSIWPLLGPEVTRRAVEALADDLESGAWDERHGHLRTQPDYPSSLRVLTAR